MQICVVASGCLTPLGNTQSTVDSMLEQRSAIKQSSDFGILVSLARFPEGFSVTPESLAQNLQYQIKSIEISNSKETLFIFAAAKGSLASIESGIVPEQSLLQNQAEQFAGLLRLDQTDHISVSNACASGIAAIDMAADYLNAQLYSTVVIAGFELISEFTVSGFHSLGAISSFGARPFDKNRSGMSLGEGAGLVVLRREIPTANSIVIRGSATSNDANHRTGPSRDGSGLARAISESLRESALRANQIGAIKCHGTATPYNDAMESKALFTVFGTDQPPAVSLKGHIGHLSGVGSIVETVLAIEFLNREIIPGTFGFEASESEEPIGISKFSQKIEQPRIALIAAGFGGLNAVSIIEKIS